MPYRIYKLDFQEKNLNLDQDLNHKSPDQLDFQEKKFEPRISRVGTWISHWLRAPG